MRIFIAAMLLMSLFAAFGCAQPRDGINGTNGTNGLNGQDGATGATGPAGANGTNGTSVTVVKLCPGTTVYPSTFIEVAFCIDHKLYAVYSANGGFETEIVPGTYDSRAIGSSCSFVVQPNCVVTH